MESSAASELLKLLDFDLNTNNGKKMKINGKKSINDTKYEGTVEIDDFILSDGPFLADFLTLFSLTGLAIKLKGGGIFFENYKGDYIYDKDNIDIKDSLIKGSELGIQFDATLNLQNDEIFAQRFYHSCLYNKYIINKISHSRRYYHCWFSRRRFDR